MDLGKRGEGVNRAPSQGHDVLSGNTSDQQGIRDERPMTAPWDRFGAH